ncbi:Uncharacterised protein [uncultured archaeon]|nr:Uncharacterised protein [uncultured archaeon]
MLYVLIFVGIMAVACIATTNAVISSLWNADQQGTQETIYTVDGDYNDFTLPAVCANVTGSSYASPASVAPVSPLTSAPSSPVLSITTRQSNLRLVITCNNPTELTTSYSNLTLSVFKRGSSAAVGTLNCLTSNELVYTLPIAGVYNFDYRFNYTSLNPGNATINLNVNVLAPS